MRSAPGTPSLTWRVSASGFAAHSLFASEDEVALALSAALRTASARLLADLSLKSSVRSWFESIGAYSERVGTQMAGVPQGSSHDATAPSMSGKIAIVSNELKEQYGMQTTQCLRKSLEGLDPQMQIISEGEVRDAFFPWLEYGVLSGYSVDAPISQMMQERARQIDVEFVVFPTDAHTGTAVKGPFLCGGGYGGAGCLGTAEVERNSEVTAAIWDLRQGARAQSLTGQGHAKDALIGLVLPIWIPGGGSTRTHACHELATALLDVMHGDSHGRLESIAAPAPAESFANAATVAAPLPESAAADAGTWSDELSLRFHAVRWFQGTDNVASSRAFIAGKPGTLRVTDTAMMFDLGPSVGDPTGLHLSFDEVASVEYRTSRIDGHIGRQAYYAVVTRRNGQVDSFAVVNLGSAVRANTKALVLLLQSKLRVYGIDASRARSQLPKTSVPRLTRLDS